LCDVHLTIQNRKKRGSIVPKPAAFSIFFYS
jgi:hypothetical protein